VDGHGWWQIALIKTAFNPSSARKTKEDVAKMHNAHPHQLEFETDAKDNHHNTVHHC
jgi:hypothetical protein